MKSYNMNMNMAHEHKHEHGHGHGHEPEHVQVYFQGHGPWAYIKPMKQLCRKILRFLSR
jgi:hypothetical protein